MQAYFANALTLRSLTVSPGTASRTSSPDASIPTACPLFSRTQPRNGVPVSVRSSARSPALIPSRFAASVGTVNPRREPSDRSSFDNSQGNKRPSLLEILPGNHCRTKIDLAVAINNAISSPCLLLRQVTFRYVGLHTFRHPL